MTMTALVTINEYGSGNAICDITEPCGFLCQFSVSECGKIFSPERDGLLHDNISYSWLLPLFLLSVVVGATISVVFLGWIFFPVYIASGSLTTIDYLKKRFGSLRIEIYMSVLTIVLTIFTKTSVELYAVYKLLQTVFSLLSSTTICMPVLLIAVLIPASGGVRSVVYTNTYQALFLAIGGAIISYFCFNTFQSYIELKEKFYEAWPNTTRLHFGENSTYKYTTCGIPHATSYHIIRPYNNLELPWPGMIFGVTITNLWYWCCDPLIVQTGLGAKSIKHCKYACLITGYVKILSVLFMVLPGLIARIIHTNSVACADPDICQHTCGIRSGCSNLAFPSIFLDIVPPNYRGLVLAAVVACSITSLAACFNSGSTIFAINIYRNIRPGATDLELVCITKAVLVVMAVASFLWLRVVEHSPNLYNYIHSLTSLLAPPILTAYISGILWSRATEKSVFISLMGGLVLGLGRLVWESTGEDIPCGEEKSSLLPDIIQYFHFLHFAIFLFVLCLVYIVLTGIYTEPILMVHLYRLVYWLRHSKLDRVDLTELNIAYKKLGAIKLEKGDHKLASKLGGNETKQGKTCAPVLAIVCCLNKDTASNIMSNNEMRETSKFQGSIKESPGHAKALNVHAVLLLLVSAVMWGFFS